MGDDLELPAPGRPRAELADALGLSAGALDRARRASEDRIAEVCAALYGAPPWPHAEATPDPEDGLGVNARFLRDHYALAASDDAGRALIGLVDPGDPGTLEGLRFALGPDIQVRTLTLSAWRKAQRQNEPGDDRPASVEAQASGLVAASWLDDAERLRDIARDAPVVRITDQILQRAFLLNASDVHIEQKLDHTRVRFRIDGVLQDEDRLSPDLGPGLIARVKVLSDLDVAERRAPQDGRTTISVRGAPVDVRVSTTPTVFGESLVVRLLTRRDVDYALDRLGLRPSIVEGLEGLLGRSHGLVLVTGPTGSGKTTTLYAALRLLATGRNKILTAEDPVEYVFEDILQCQVNEAAGFTFAGALRAFLRHDPDVILVGEIRDAETARLAVQASLTGHLVLATVHTNDAASTPSRLIDMGVERYLLGDALIGVLAQRLARRLCPDCGVRRILTPDERRAAAEAGVRASHAGEAKGCPACGQTGRKGRRAVSELMLCDEVVGEAVASGASAADIRALLRGQPGYASLRRDALEQSANGLVDWGDAWRVADR